MRNDKFKLSNVTFITNYPEIGKPNVQIMVGDKLWGSPQGERFVIMLLEEIKRLKSKED